MTPGPGSAPPAPHEIGRSLHQQPQLAVHQLLGTHHEPGHPHKSGCTTVTLNHRQGSLLLQTYIPQNGGALAHTVGFPNQLPELTTPHTSSRRDSLTVVNP
jgi:hypothetical protein